MAKKKVAPKAQSSDEIGFINIVLHGDGTYSLDTRIEVNPMNLSLYANILADFIEGKINKDIIQRFAESDDNINQQVAQFLTLFLKTYRNQDKPLVSPDRVFRRNKMK